MKRASVLLTFASSLQRFPSTYVFLTNMQRILARLCGKPTKPGNVGSLGLLSPSSLEAPQSPRQKGSNCCDDTEETESSPVDGGPFLRERKTGTGGKSYS